MGEQTDVLETVASISSVFPWEQGTPDRLARPRNPFVPFEASEVEQSIVQCFEKTVNQHSNRLAVKGGDGSFTYQELNEMANRVAWAVLAEGQRGAPTVALLAERGAPAIAALMGILKAGKAYVPLDPTYPLARLEYMLRDSRSDLILADDENVALARELATRTLAGGSSMDSGGHRQSVFRLLSLSELDAGLSTTNPGVAISPDAYAYILYTSGTTGRPKGVLGDHRQVLHFSKVFINMYHICPEDRVSLVDSLCFSASLSKIFPTLLRGAALMPFDIKEEGVGRLTEWLVRERVTMYGSVPMVFRQFCELLAKSPHTAGLEFPDLRIIRLGGDRVEKQDVDLYKKHFAADCILQVGYGATEAKAISFLFINKDAQITESIVPVGYASDDVQILLLGEGGQPVELGQAGEVAVKSRYLSPGYWRMPEETQAKFLPDPEGGGERIYLTGDLGRMAADGCLTHLGRKDFQVKIRGFRVEIAGIESVLLGLETVKEAVVVVREGQNGEQRLVGYIVPAVEPAPTTSSLRSALAEQLPDYMIPAAFVVLDEMPLNANGKVDRLNLPEPGTSRPELEGTYVAPRDELERQVVGIWEEVLGVEPIGVRDGFFDLGGDSLLAVNLFVRIGQATGVKLPLATLLRAPTVEQLVEVVREEGRPKGWTSLVAIQPEGARPPFYCVHGHRGQVLFCHRLTRYLGPDQPFYAFQRQGLDGRHPYHTRIVEMAAHYVKELQEFQPRGPYYLGGFCMGGAIAFEMAQRLVEQGEEVVLLALMDATNGFGRPRGGLVQSVGVHLRNLVRLGSRERVAYVRLKGGQIAQELKEKLGGNGRESSTVKMITGEPPRVVRDYVPRPYRGRMVLIRGDDQPARFYLDPYLGWGGLVEGGIEVERIAVERGYVVDEPYVRETAAKLQAYIEEALAARSVRGADATGVVQPVAHRS